MIELLRLILHVIASFFKPRTSSWQKSQSFANAQRASPAGIEATTTQRRLLICHLAEKNCASDSIEAGRFHGGEHCRVRWVSRWGLPKTITSKTRPWLPTKRSPSGALANQPLDRAFASPPRGTPCVLPQSALCVGTLDQEVTAQCDGKG